MDQHLDHQSHNLPSTEVDSGRGFSIEAIIAGWLNESAKSKRTRTAYEANLDKFRALLKSRGKDLIYQSDDLDVEIADFAQVFMGMPEKEDRTLTPATQAQRIATISSFYEYAIRRRHVRHIANPVTLMKRPKVQPFAASQAITPQVLKERLADIDRTTQQGKQDIAILLVALSTGRRVSELAGLRREHIEKQGAQILLHFEHTKGDKKIADLLEPEITQAVEACLATNHQGAFWRLPANTPLWIDCYHTSRYGETLGYHGIANICKRRLGTSKVHTLRGSFAVLMQEAGAKLTDIQRRLQHDNAATTGIYLNKLKESQNAYSGKIVELLGLKDN